MARKKQSSETSSIMDGVDMQGRMIMAEYVCELIEAGDPDLDLKKQVIVELMNRLSVHHLDQFDVEVEALLQSRKEGRA